MKINLNNKFVEVRGEDDNIIYSFNPSNYIIYNDDYSSEQILIGNKIGGLQNIILNCSLITEINGTPFEGNRDALKESLSSVFKASENLVPTYTQTITRYTNNEQIEIQQPFSELNIVFFADGYIDGVFCPSGFTENITRKINSSIWVTGTDFTIIKYV